MTWNVTGELFNQHFGVPPTTDGTILIVHCFYVKFTHISHFEILNRLISSSFFLL